MHMIVYEYNYAKTWHFYTMEDRRGEGEACSNFFRDNNKLCVLCVHMFDLCVSMCSSPY